MTNKRAPEGTEFRVFVGNRTGVEIGYSYVLVHGVGIVSGRVDGVDHLLRQVDILVISRVEIAEVARIQLLRSIPHSPRFLSHRRARLANHLVHRHNALLRRPFRLASFPLTLAVLPLALRGGLSHLR